MSQYNATDPTIWQGRVDSEEASAAFRWHQRMQCVDLTQSPTPLAQQLTLLGFCSDVGVQRNKGRVGAVAGPAAIRRALANASASASDNFTDAGDIHAHNDDLEAAQAALGQQLAKLIAAGAKPLVLGGGHEVAWASFQGLIPSLLAQPQKTLGIINFDAHFDLRNPTSQGSSGTPFRQIAQWCQAKQLPFNYLTAGLNPSANTDALFDYARDHKVQWITDIECESATLGQLRLQLNQFLQPLQRLYITVCLDVFPAAFAPGVSAPAALGVSPARMLAMLEQLLTQCQQQGIEVMLLDIAEMNPSFDVDGQTAKLAARIVWEYNRLQRAAV